MARHLQGRRAHLTPSVPSRRDAALLPEEAERQHAEDLAARVAALEAELARLRQRSNQ